MEIFKGKSSERDVPLPSLTIRGCSGVLALAAFYASELEVKSSAMDGGSYCQLKTCSESKISIDKPFFPEGFMACCWAKWTRWNALGWQRACSRRLLLYR